MSTISVIRAPTLEMALQELGYEHMPRITGGRFVRFPAMGKGRHNRSAWLLADSGIGGALIGDWTLEPTGAPIWRWEPSEVAALSQESYRKYLARFEKTMAQYEQDRASQWAQVAERAQARYARSDAARHDHPYLQAKGVQSGWHLGPLRQRGQQLIVPVIPLWGEFAGHCQSLQFIGPDGTKRFMKGGKLKGGMCRIRPDIEDEIVICEGIATALTLANVYCTSAQVVAAFNADNLADVARALKGYYTDARFIVAADNDRHTEGNPGMAKASEAALAIGAEMAIPTFSAQEPGSDWNDRYLLDTEGTA